MSEHLRNNCIAPFLKRISHGVEKCESGSFFSARLFTDAYNEIYNSCNSDDKNSPMYDLYVSAIQEFVNKQFVQELLHAKTQNAIVFLNKWCNIWTKHTLVVKGMRCLFVYVNRHVSSRSRPTLETQGYLILKTHVFDVFQQNIVDALSTVIDNIREDHVTHQENEMLLKTCMNTFIELGSKVDPNNILSVYALLATQFIESSKTQILAKQKTWLHALSCSDYLREVETYMERELNFTRNVTHPTTSECLGRELQKILLDDAASVVLNKDTGVTALLESESREDLIRVYKHFKSNQDALGIITDLLNGFITKKLTNIQGELIQGMIKIHLNLHEFVMDVFDNDVAIQKCFKQSFQNFINANTTIPQTLATYCNDILKKTTCIESTELALKNLALLYGYIRDKDVFEIAYQNALAERLLTNDVKSEQEEKRMIAMLKAQCGYQWCSKLEGMFRDIALSKELNTNFSQLSSHNYEMNVIVCTQTHWPNFQKKTEANVVIPREIASASDTFKTFYLAMYNGRKLIWATNQGTAELKISFGSYSKEFVVTSIMMFVLLLFNSATTLTTAEIAKSIGVTIENLKQHLLSLAHPKTGRVLMKKPMKPLLLEDDQFTLSDKYDSKLYRVHIPLMKMQEKKDIVAVNPDRPYVIDAAIVRIMKARRQLTYSELQAEVVKQLMVRFLPDPKSIKQRIEHLIDQDYLARDETNYTVLNYIA
jgi:hypothetical protein